jgi:tetratricopeptide (TPR) repeat protein
LIFLFLLCVVISTLNPFGLKAFYWPFGFYFGDPSFHSQMEFESPFKAADFKQFSVQNYELLVFVVAALFLANIKKIKLADLFIMLPLFYLSAKFVRNIAVFAAFAALIMPPYLDSIFFTVKNYFIKKKGGLNSPSFRLAGQAVLILLLLFFTIKTSYGMITNDFYIRDQRSRRFGFGVSEINFPINAGNFIKENNLQGNLFNDYALGTFVNWWLFPERQSFIDGHSYTLDLLHYYQKVMSGFVSYREVAAKYNINYFFLSYFEKDTPVLVNQLYHDRQNWVPVYFDELSIIFIANKPENKEIIDKYAIDFEKNKNFDPENLKSIKEKVDFSVGRANRGVFFYNVGLWEKAEYEFQKAVEAEPRDYVSYQNLGSVLQQLSKYDLAISAYESALKTNSKFAPAHYNLGLLFQKKDMMDEAIKEFKKTIGINREYPLANYNLGVIYETKGDKVSARIYYQNELKINPGSTDAQNALNRVSSGAGYSSESIDDLKKEIGKDPNNADLHFRLAIAYGLLNNQDAALEEFNKAAEIKPDFALAHLNLGNVYSLKNMPEDAKKEYEKAIELDPKAADAYLNLGVIYRYTEKDNQKAVEYWQKFLDLAPNDPQAKTIQQEIITIVKEESGKK